MEEGKEGWEEKDKKEEREVRNGGRKGGQER